ncbi:M16 family metallopeptidase [Thiomicrorhabdus lithotrophica]|uniref:Insulinase family protein n=1 Tax=Thiomicrorhabdus lithotrophica TaxID=2949997 RepID=A0ABY8CCZ7_9GAMM|nr:pitrilysin family protein [Thiomicrorhabdus lithotrophica]WEJ62416.1 insulinase family protein [Thiomicrorhabdus lithotrophica]
MKNRIYHIPKRGMKACLVVASMLLSFSAMATVDIQSWQTTSGAKVMYVQANQLPMLDIEVAFDAGSARDADSWGVAAMTSGLLGTATSKLNEDQVSETFNSIGAQIGSSVTRDSASISIRTLTRPEIMQTALNTFETLISDTQFTKPIFDREMQRLKIGLKQKSVEPQVISNETLWKTLYGNHPYAHPTSGTLESVESITLDSLKAFYKKYYVASNAVISIVGNVNKAQAKEIAEKLMQNLPKGQKAPGLVAPKAINKHKSITIDFDSTQTYYSLAQLGIERGHPDYAALFVGNHILGGSGFGSLLMEEVREKRGLVYSVYSYFAPQKVAGPFLIGLSTKNASALEADKVVRETLDGFLKDFTDEKLQAIKDNLIGGFPLRIDSNAKILGYISMIGFYGLPLDYLEWFPKQIEQVTKEDVLEAWNMHIKPDEMLKIMVGKPE